MLRKKPLRGKAESRALDSSLSCVLRLVGIFAVDQFSQFSGTRLGSKKRKTDRVWRVEIEFRTGEGRAEKEKVELRRSKVSRRNVKQVFPRSSSTKDRELELAFR